MYAAHGRASIPPERLLKACLLMALCSVRSERQFCERLEYDLRFKWFLDLNVMDRSFDHSVFAKNRQRLLAADVAREFLLEIVEQARVQRLLSEEHFSVDGTLLAAWASVKSFRVNDAYFDVGACDAGVVPGRSAMRCSTLTDHHGYRRTSDLIRAGARNRSAAPVISPKLVFQRTDWPVAQRLDANALNGGEFHQSYEGRPALFPIRTVPLHCPSPLCRYRRWQLESPEFSAHWQRPSPRQSRLL